jgi:hypothetical protein
VQEQARKASAAPSAHTESALSHALSAVALIRDYIATRALSGVSAAAARGHAQGAPSLLAVIGIASDELKTARYEARW